MRGTGWMNPGVPMDIPKGVSAGNLYPKSFRKRPLSLLWLFKNR